jgi:hypothetical protein
MLQIQVQDDKGANQPIAASADPLCRNKRSDAALGAIF